MTDIIQTALALANAAEFRLTGAGTFASDQDIDQLCRELRALIEAHDAPVIYGDSHFESWFSTKDMAALGTKQLCRDAYAAGMAEARREPDYAAMEREHLGDPDKKTGVYAQDAGLFFSQCPVCYMKFADLALHEANSEIVRLRAALAAQPQQATAQQNEPVAKPKVCWLVEEFNASDNSTGRYMLDQGALSITTDIQQARQFLRSRTATFRATDMREKWGTAWRPVSHVLRAAQPQQATEPAPEVDAAIALLHRMLEAPTNWITPAWKDAIRPVLAGLITQGRSVDAQPQQATSDDLIELSEELQKLRATHIVGAVRALRSPCDAPTQFDAGYDLACEEILHRLEHEEWELTDAGWAPVGGHPAAQPQQATEDDQEWDRNAERLTQEAFGLGGGINPNATSVDDLFLDDDPEPPNPALVKAAESHARLIQQAAQPVAWQPMRTAPKDGTAVLVLLEGSNIPYAVRWEEGSGPLGGEAGWHMTWDGHHLSPYDGPRCWMACPAEPAEQPQQATDKIGGAA